MINRFVLSLFCVCCTFIGFSQNRGGANNMAAPVMYEVNTRQFSEKGTFIEVTQNLRRLKGLGIDIVWMMPIHPIGVKNRKGTLGSYYSVQDYRGINPAYGDTADFRRLVKTAHNQGMKVIIDWVANHTAWDHAWIKQHPEWYVRDKKGNIQTQYDWSDVAKLDFTNADMRAAMISDMLYWVNTFGIDGFRCDVAFLVPQDFWEQARAQLETVKPMYMLAEMEWNADITATPNTYFDKAFNTSYGWNFMGVTQDMAKGKKTLYDFRKELQENYRKFPDKMTKLYFITNHDENSWNGTVDEKYGTNWKLYATLCYTLPKSLPLMYSGEEAGLKRRLSFFEKDPILRKEWADTSRYAWYKSLIQLRHTNKALWNLQNVPPTIREIPFPGADSSITKNVFAFSRKADTSEVIVITNFGEADAVFQPSMLTFDPTKFKLLFNDRQFTINDKGLWILKANQNAILYK